MGIIAQGLYGYDRMSGLSKLALVGSAAGGLTGLQLVVATLIDGGLLRKLRLYERVQLGDGCHLTGTKRH